MLFQILTTFPDIIDAVASQSIVGRAREKGIIGLEPVNLRDFTHDAHHSTDDAPYGGGPGMVMRCEPVFEAVESLTSGDSGPGRIILMTPQGRRFDQRLAEELAREEHIVMICGRYEGFDERIRSVVTDEVSIGDYVVTGGELPALIVAEAVARLLPGVLGADESSEWESFAGGLLEYPQYTRPAECRGMRVPDVLLSGHHAEIQKWRRRQSIERTLRRRPDLLEKADLTSKEIQFIDELKGNESS